MFVRRCTHAVGVGLCVTFIYGCSALQGEGVFLFLLHHNLFFGVSGFSAKSSEQARNKQEVKTAETHNTTTSHHRRPSPEPGRSTRRTTVTRGHTGTTKLPTTPSGRSRRRSRRGSRPRLRRSHPHPLRRKNLLPTQAREEGSRRRSRRTRKTSGRSNTPRRAASTGTTRRRGTRSTRHHAASGSTAEQTHKKGDIAECGGGQSRGRWIRPGPPLKTFF